VDPFEDRLGYSERPIPTFAATNVAFNDQDARLIAEQAPDGVFAHIPHLSDLCDGVVALRKYAQGHLDPPNLILVASVYRENFGGSILTASNGGIGADLPASPSYSLA
jgi:hypothetical protein